MSGKKWQVADTLDLRSLTPRESPHAKSVLDSNADSPTAMQRRLSLPATFSSAPSVEIERRQSMLRRCQSSGAALRGAVQSPANNVSNDDDTPSPDDQLQPDDIVVSPKSCELRRKQTCCPTMRITGMCRLPSCPYVHETGRAHRLIDSPSWKVACKDVPCRFLQLTGKCLNGDQCNYSHTLHSDLKGSPKKESTTTSKPASRTAARSMTRSRSRQHVASALAMANARPTGRIAASSYPVKSSRKGPRIVGAGPKKGQARCMPSLSSVGASGIARHPHGLVGSHGSGTSANMEFCHLIGLADDIIDVPQQFLRVG